MAQRSDLVCHQFYWNIVMLIHLHLSMTARRSNQSILKETSPGCSLEGLMLKLKLQYFGHLTRTDSLEKTLESPLDCREIQPVHPKGDQPWVFTGRIDAEAETPILCPADAKN